MATLSLIYNVDTDRISGDAAPQFNGVPSIQHGGKKTLRIQLVSGSDASGSGTATMRPTCDAGSDDPPGCPVISVATFASGNPCPVGGSVSIWVTASTTGGHTLSYSWTKDGDPTAYTGPSITIENFQPEDAGTYVCTVSSDCGSTAVAAIAVAVD